MGGGGPLAVFLDEGVGGAVGSDEAVQWVGVVAVGVSHWQGGDDGAVEVDVAEALVEDGLSGFELAVVGGVFDVVPAVGTGLLCLAVGGGFDALPVTVGDAVAIESAAVVVLSS